MCTRRLALAVILEPEPHVYELDLGKRQFTAQ